ncbi:MCE family protein [Rhodococcus qingshengii]|uniref:MCE family protein n=1 Tax=Rhodococcus qingshengii TaxID=334542 RepID=UPI0024B97640|nr:MCE family protein [Rhodococcus qingshengii]MDJ0441104.1 MCE family protein [Rhodococcus qingshengii]
MNTFRIGLIGIVLTIATVLAAQNYDKIPFISVHREYSAYFAEAGGLKPDSPVNVAGVTVGKVTKMELEGDRILVRFSASGVTLGTETQAAIKTRTVLGSKTLDISPRGDIPLSNNDVIPLEHTSSPYLLTDTLGELTTTISGLNTDDLSQALGVLGDTLDKSEPNLGAALDGVTRLSSSISSRDEILRSLLGNAEGVTDVLATRSSQINTLILDGATLFTALDQRRTSIDILLTNLSSVSQQLKSLISENEAQLTPTLDKVNSIVDLLEERKDDITKTLLPLTQYATSLGESVSAGPFFKAYIGNLLPGQFLQPFIDAAFSQAGIDPGILGTTTYPIDGGYNSPPGVVPPTDTAPIPNTPVPVVPAPPLAPFPAIPGLGG